MSKTRTCSGRRHDGTETPTKSEAARRLSSRDNPRQLEPQSTNQAFEASKFAVLRKVDPAKTRPRTPISAHCARIQTAVQDQATERTMLAMWLEEEDILGGLPMSPGGEA